MKKILLTQIFLLACFIGLAQCPTEDIIINTQAEIDNFSANYPNCTFLTHQVIIDGNLTEITNLNGLSGLTHANVLYIQGTLIVDLSGLENLISAESLAIGANRDMVTLNGLGSLQQVNILNFFFNNALPSLTGMDNLVSIGGIALLGNEILRDVSQFLTLDTIQHLSITRNGFTDLSGFENIHTITGDLFIAEENMEDLDEFSNLQNVGGSIYLWHNEVLSDISALNSITSVGDDLEFVDCDNAEVLTGFENIQSVGGRLRIGDNELLTDISILGNIQSAGELDVYSNVSLQSLQGLEGLETVNGVLGNVLIHDMPISDLSGLQNLASINGGIQLSNLSALQNLNGLSNMSELGYLTIYGCTILPSLDGLENLQSIDRKLLLNDNSTLNSILAIYDVSPTIIDEVVVTNNIDLSVCDIDLICAIIGDPNVDKEIHDNAAGCTSVAEVEAECLLSVSDVDLNNAIGIYPNPASNMLYINVSDTVNFMEATIYSVLGERLMDSSEEIFNVSGLSQGVYFVEVTTDQGNISKKILKE